MHPLLVSAVANTAGNFIDRWANRSGVSKAAPTQPDSFQSVLDTKTAAAAEPAAKTPEQTRLERMARLRTELLDAPEIRAVLDAADPTKPAKLSLTPDGRVLTGPAGYDSKPLLLSPNTAEIARELASLTAASGGASFITRAAGPNALNAQRNAPADLTPQTGVTTLR